MTDYVKIADKKIPTVLAITQDEQERGLMYQKWPPPVMSFVYTSPKVNKFWMHRTPSPLDIVFSHSNKIISICQGEPYSTKLIGDDRLSDLVVEFPAGTCQAFGVNVGDSIELECSENSLMKIFMLKNGFHI
jgi:uncharacterized membrane protein (UPF0127 family)